MMEQDLLQKVWQRARQVCHLIYLSVKEVVYALLYN